MKHLVEWLTNPSAFGPINIDAQCQVLPPNYNITLFPKGISSLSHITGKEHKAMCQILLGLIINLPLPSRQVASCMLKATQALLDFLFLAQYSSHTTDTL